MRGIEGGDIWKLGRSLRGLFRRVGECAGGFPFWFPLWVGGVSFQVCVWKGLMEMADVMWRDDARPCLRCFSFYLLGRLHVRESIKDNLLEISLLFHYFVCYI